MPASAAVGSLGSSESVKMQSVSGHSQEAESETLEQHGSRPCPWEYGSLNPICHLSNSSFAPQQMRPYRWVVYDEVPLDVWTMRLGEI